MTATQIKALIAGCSAALELEKTSTLDISVQRPLSIVAICQFILEGSTPPRPDGSGGWFTSPLSQPPINNPFGIKAEQRLAEYGAFTIETWEVVEGQRVDQQAEFQKFPSLAAAFIEHQRLLLSKPQIQRVLGQGWQAITVALGPPIDSTHCGYSTSPNYAELLQSLGNQCHLDRSGFIEWWAAGANIASEPMISSVGA